ncbi:7 transmembrane receptor (rhodopsin family) domain-containing protein [Ditylenchus destructor]|uniref:7 transmembrane receptor (Rhodopsin family) domain-containing protein n=1 Tax=Ditylenchus destructor TaxID=166010 RepID=A0AAD4N1U9_9BILA|nr:7 transmembrane receptor (rhodopsin family) domain-containing protein [Ditylenchus destructor]
MLYIEYKALNCLTDLNTTHVVDPSGLLDDCTIWQIDYDLNELELDTRVNHSHDPCELAGLRGTVVIAQNGSARDLANKFYEDINPHSNSSCQKSFVLVFSSEPDVFNWRFGSDSPISGWELKDLLDKTHYDEINDPNGTALNFPEWVQIGITEYRKTKESVWEWNVWFLYVFRTAMVIGFFGNVICIATIFFSKLIQSYVNKYLFVMLLADMLFNVWVLARPLREEMQHWDYWWCTFFRYSWDSFTCASCNVLVILTMERFFAIVFPLQHMRYSHVNRWMVMLVSLLPVQLWALYLHTLFPYFHNIKVTAFKDNWCDVAYNIEYKARLPFQISQYFLPLFAVALVNVTIAIKMGITRKMPGKSPQTSKLTMEVDKIMNDIDAQHAETPSKCDNNQKANPVVPRKDAEIASGYKNKQVVLFQVNRSLTIV